jgi:hypothetical protein
LIIHDIDVQRLVRINHLLHVFGLSFHV